MKAPEDILLPRTILFSVIFHGVIIISFFAYKINIAPVLPVERVITVELKSPEFREQKPVVVPAPAKTRMPPAEPVKRSRPADRVPLPATLKSPPVIVPQAVSLEKIPAGQGDMAALPAPAPVSAPARASGVEVVAPIPASGAVSEGGRNAKDADAAAKGRYRARVRELIEKCKEYPLMARKLRKEGTCSVICVLDRNGSIRNSRVAKTSGHELLDRSALRAVNSVGQFPPVPAEIRGDEVNVEVPISFRLSGH